MILKQSRTKPHRFKVLFLIYDKITVAYSPGWNTNTIIEIYTRSGHVGHGRPYSCSPSAAVHELKFSRVQVNKFPVDASVAASITPNHHYYANIRNNDYNIISIIYCSVHVKSFLASCIVVLYYCVRVYTNLSQIPNTAHAMSKTNSESVKNDYTWRPRCPL